ncbi:MAG: hypothetical protein ACRBN8_21550 [Nannocystales bacterium]
MRISTSATALLPDRRTSDPLAAVRGRVRVDADPDCDWWTPDNPAPDSTHWAAVGRAVASVATREAPADGGETAWTKEQTAMRALAQRYRCPLPPPRDGYEFAAVVPPPPGVGPRWVTVCTHPDFDETGFWNLGDAAVRVGRIDPQTADVAAVWHIAAEALVPVQGQPFLDILPELFESTGYNENGRWHDWHEAEDFAALPHELDAYGLASALHPGSKIGGFPISGAEDRLLRSSPHGNGSMTYAYALASDFFDVRFGDAGVLHVWLSETDASCRFDSA